MQNITLKLRAPGQNGFKTYWASGKGADGKRHRFSLRTNSKSEAERRLAKIIAEQTQEVISGPKITFGQAAIDYLDHGGRAKQGGSHTGLEALVREFGESDIQTITPQMVRQAAHRIKPGCKPATWNRHIYTPIIAVLNHAQDVWAVPAPRIRKLTITEKRKTPKCGDMEWVLSFAQQARSDNLHRLGALAVFMFTTGTRINEALRLKWTDVDLVNKSVILQTKTTEQEPRFFTDYVRAILINLERHSSGRVFGYPPGKNSGPGGGFYRVWNRTIERAGIPRLTPHDAGRRAAYNHARKNSNIDPAALAKSLGWASTATPEKHYLAISEAERKAVANVFEMAGNGQAKQV